MTSSPAFVLDPRVAELGSGARPPSWGLVLVTNWPAAEALREPYEELRRRIDEVDDDGVFYTYPFEYLHITVATLANFKTGPLAEGAPGADSAARDRATAAWKSALERAFVAGGQCTGFLEVNRPKVDAQAAFFPVSDLDTAVKRARETLAKQIPLVAQHQIDTSARSVNLPDIVHSTFARYRRAPSDPEALALRLETDVLPAWPAHGVRVPVSTFSLVLERAPYMHVAHSRETIVAQFPAL